MDWHTLTITDIPTEDMEKLRAYWNSSLPDLPIEAVAYGILKTFLDEWARARVSEQPNAE